MSSGTKNYSEPCNSGRLRVALLIHSFALGGAELIVRNLAIQLAKFGVEVLIIPLRAGPAEARSIFAALTEYQIKIGEPYSGKLRSVREFLRLRNWVKEQLSDFNADIVHSHCELPDFINATLQLSCFKRVRTVHNERFWGNVIPSEKLCIALENFINVLGRFDRVVCISNKTRRNNWVSKTDIIYNALSLTKKRVPTKERDHCLPKKIHIVGRFSDQKGQYRFLLHCKQRFKGLKNMPFELVFYGKLDSTTYVRDFVEEAAGRVTFAGVQTDQNFLYTGASWVAIPSKYEGLSSVMVEAASSGVPVVTMNVSGAEDVVETYQCGYVVDSFDEMIDIISDIDPPKISEKCSRELQSLFSIVGSAEQHRDLYLQLKRKSRMRN